MGDPLEAMKITKDDEQDDKGNVAFNERKTTRKLQTWI
jgi:hypothetical protein